MEFPRLVYRSAQEHTLVQNEEELLAALKEEGFFASVPEALFGVSLVEGKSNESEVSESKPKSKSKPKIKVEQVENAEGNEGQDEKLLTDI